MRKKRALLAAFASVLALSGPMALAADQDAPLYITIARGGESAPRSVIVPLNKAVIVDLPVDARDVLLSNPEIADSVLRTAKRVFLIGRKMGQTNAFFFDAAGHQIANLELRIEPDVAPLNSMFKRFAPNSSVKAEAVNGALVISGSVKSGAEADRIVQLADKFGTSNGQKPELVNLLNVEGKEQVLVKVRVVEMSRTLVKQLGVNVNAENMLNQLLPKDTFFNVATAMGYSVNGKLLGGLTGTGGVAHTILQPSSVTYPGGGIIPGVGVTDAGVGGFSTSPIQDASGAIIGTKTTLGPATPVTNRQIDGSIQAFERAGLLRVLAEPNLTAISGESAKFLAGGEFPVPVRSNNGELTVEFKPFGVGLAFTPVVLSGGRISLKLSTEVSEISSEGAVNTGDTTFTDATGQTQTVHGISIPALQVRRAETTVEMPSGGALMMAGLIQEKTRQALEGLPGAKDLPVFGSLFRSRDFVNNETELVIIVTPYLVEATKPDKLKTPADGYVNAGDMASFLSGRLNAVYKGEPPAADGKKIQGPAGHVIE
jgi:pilus assembly protein CpaC